MLGSAMLIQGNVVEETAPTFATNSNKALVSLILRQQMISCELLLVPMWLWNGKLGILITNMSRNALLVRFRKLAVAAFLRE